MKIVAFVVVDTCASHCTVVPVCAYENPNRVARTNVHDEQDFYTLLRRPRLSHHASCQHSIYSSIVIVLNTKYNAGTMVQWYNGTMVQLYHQDFSIRLSSSVF